MLEPLDTYLQIERIKPEGLAQRIGKTRQCIDNWLKRGGYKVDYNGRTMKINWIKSPGRMVYVKGSEGEKP